MDGLTQNQWLIVKDYLYRPYSIKTIARLYGLDVCDVKAIIAKYHAMERRRADANPHQINQGKVH